MTATHTPEEKINKLLAQADKHQNARDFDAATKILIEASVRINQHFGLETKTPNVYHATLHLHWASLHSSQGREHDSIEAALSGLHVMNELHDNSPQHHLWQRLMGFVAHH